MLSKLFASSFLFSNSYLLSKNFQRESECENKNAEQAAKDLDRIFAEASEGGMPPDPEEIQEMLAKAQGRTIRRPPPFMRLMTGIKFLTMSEAIDGVKFDFTAPFSQRFQLGGSWNFSNTKQNKFELSTALSSAGENMMNQDEMSFISTRSDSNGKLELTASLNLGNNYSVKTEGFFMDSDLQKSHVSFELMKEFKDSHIAYKFEGGAHAISMMQTLSAKFIAGYQMYYIPHTKDVHFCYGGHYTHDIHQFFAQYVPMATKETFSFGYVGKPSKRLTLFSELKGSLEGVSDTTLGFRIRFLEGMLTGSLSSSFKATSTYKHIVENILQIQFNSQIDFQKPEKPAVFGISLSVGGM